MPFYSPLRYPGGKNCIFKFVANLFNENDMQGASYAEPYAGGAGLALRLLFEEYVDRIYINDFDESIYSFWKTITEDADAFCSWVSDVSVSMDTWHQSKEILKSAREASCFERAKATFFLNRTNVSGVIKGGVIGGLEQRGKYKIDARFNKEDLILRIQKIARFRNRIVVSNLDGIDFVKKLDRRKKDIFIYLDPPYYQKGAGLYMNAYTERDHEKLSRYVHRMKKKWMVSYDNHEFILNLYKEHPKLVYKLSQSASNRVGDEVLVFSNKVSFFDSMENLSSPLLLS